MYIMYMHHDLFLTGTACPHGKQPQNFSKEILVSYLGIDV